MTGSTTVTCYRVTGNARQAWNAFCLVSTHLLGNVRAKNYKELVEDMLMQSISETWLQYVSKDPLP